MNAFYDPSSLESHDLKRSNALIKHLKQRIIQQGGLLSFADYMETVLYHQTFGYYSNAHLSFNHQGDFITAPEISALFAKCLATPCLQVFKQIKEASILELGAGSGKLAYDLLTELNGKQHLPRDYFIYEISPGLRHKQQVFLKSACPELFPKIKWLEQLPIHFKGIIIANEVLDALPVHCFNVENEIIKEKCVGIDDDQQSFIWQTRVSLDENFINKTQQIFQHLTLPVGYQSEINLHLPAYIKKMANILSEGIMLFIDYGYGQREYYHPERNKGTLTCFYQHKHHEDPFALPGLQDITAHVNFTTVVESAYEQGCYLQGYTTQAAFLLSCGLLEFAAKEELELDAVAQFNLHQAIKMLTFPTEMGERIKVMALGKNTDWQMIGFNFQDRSRDLE